MNAFLTRLGSGILLLIIAGAAFFFGGITLMLLVSFTALVGLFELYRAFGIWDSGISAAGMVAACLYLEAVALGWDSMLLFVLFLGLTLILGLYVFTFPKYEASQVAEAVFGLVYVPVMLSYIYRVRCLDGGQILVWLVLLFSWGSDTVAYASGMLFGKHKLTPVLSPKKTVEGAAGAVLGTAALGAIFGAAFADKLPFSAHPAAVLAALGLVGSVVSQIGDLAASAIKRNRDIKDYGNLIPGHGGILDRFDSVIVIAPAVYHLLTLFL